MKRLAVLNLIQLVTTRKRPKGTTYIHVNLINQTKVLLRRKMYTSWFHFAKKKNKKRNYLTEGTGELFCDCIRSHDHAGHLTAQDSISPQSYVPMNA